MHCWSGKPTIGRRESKDKSCEVMQIAVCQERFSSTRNSVQEGYLSCQRGMTALIPLFV